MNLHPSSLIRASLIGAAVGFVFGILGGLPFLTCMNCAFLPMGWLAPLGIGVLYALFATRDSALVRPIQGALGGAIAGGITGLVISLVSGILEVILGNTPDWLPEESASRQVGIVLTSCGLGAVGGIFLGAILGAVGGLVYAAIKGQPKQPSGGQTQ